ncbi:MAG: PorT family protein [Bacteroidales bacterium]|nr:PorT family protein [Candidatus Colimorpha merdihippi]MCQ2282646.1 PorT family protein [Bacteroidales bacterium]
MKKLTTLLALAALIAGANALHAQARIHVGAAQQNIPTSTTILNHTIHDTVSRLGFYGGLSYTIDLNHHFELTLGANANYFYEHDTVNILGMAGVTSNFTEVDLSIPIHLGYAIHFGDKIRLGIYVGPTLNFGLVNHTQYQGTFMGVSKGWTTDWFENNNAEDQDYYYERFGWSLTAGARLTIGKIGIEAGYTYGMSDNYRSANLVGRCDFITGGISYAL